MASPSSGNSYYFASHRSTANPNSREIDLISPRQEKKLAKQTSSKSAAVGVESEPAVVESFPKGSKPAEFYSRPVSMLIKHGSLFSAEEMYESHQKEMIAVPSPGYKDPPIGSYLLSRKVPVKIEPKVFFANERTFLAWLHSSVLLAGASVAIVSMSNDNLLSQLYGIVLLPIAIAFLMYSMHQYGRRSQMIRRRSPGP